MGGIRFSEQGREMADEIRRRNIEAQPLPEADESVVPTSESEADRKAREDVEAAGRWANGDRQFDDPSDYGGKW